LSAEKYFFAASLVNLGNSGAWEDSSPKRKRAGVQLVIPSTFPALDCHFWLCKHQYTRDGNYRANRAESVQSGGGDSGIGRALKGRAVGA
jgi:hypothetical protein